MTDFSSETCAMLVVIVDVERATCVFVSGSARVVFSQGCSLFLNKKTVDPFVEDSIFVKTVCRDGLRIETEIFQLFSIVHYLDISVPRDQCGDYVLEAAFQFVSGEFIMVDFLAQMV